MHCSASGTIATIMSRTWASVALLGSSRAPRYWSISPFDTTPFSRQAQNASRRKTAGAARSSSAKPSSALRSTQGYWQIAVKLATSLSDNRSIARHFDGWLTVATRSPGASSFSAPRNIDRVPNLEGLALAISPSGEASLIYNKVDELVDVSRARDGNGGRPKDSARGRQKTLRLHTTRRAISTWHGTTTNRTQAKTFTTLRRAPQVESSTRTRTRSPAR